MAAQYFLYTTLYDNTLVNRSNTSFAPLPPDTGEIYIDFLIPQTQPLYYYANSGGTGGTIVLNSEATIEAYLAGTAPPIKPDDDVIQSQFTGYTATTKTKIDLKHNTSDFNSFTGTTLPATYLSKTAFNIYSGTTATLIGTKLDKIEFSTYTGTTSAIYTNTKDPTGFLNNQNIKLTYNSANRTITLSATTGTIQYYWNGVLKSLGTSWTSTAHPATTSAYYLYSTDGTNFIWSTSVWAFTDVMVAFKPKGMNIAIREVHGIMQWNVHEELHRNLGTYKVSGGGFTVGTYAIQPASPTNADNTFGLEAITIADEDIKTSLPAWIQDSYTTLYFTGSGVTVFQTAQPNYARITVSFPNYYSWNGSTFTATEMANNTYANYYVLRIPVVSDATSQLYRAIVMSPQYSYANAASAYAEGVESLYFGDLTSLFTEGVIVERITIRTNSSYTSTGKYRINAVNIISGTRFSQVVGAVGAATTAGNVTVVPTAPYTQTNLQTLSDAYAIDITASLRKTTFATYTGTTVPNTYYNKTQINSYSASTLTNINSRLLKTTFATYTGTTVPNTYYNKTQINSYTGATATALSNKIDKVGAAVATDIATFVSGGNIQDSGKQFINIVNPVTSALDAKVPTELAVRNAINQAVAGAIILQGSWNATTNTPDLTVTGITTGFAWRVSVSGTTNLGGITSWSVGDLAVKSATGWVKVDNEDIAAIWGNISGTLSNQTDLQNALNTKLNVTSFNTYSGTTVPNTYYNKTQINAYTGTTVPNTYYNKTQINSYSASTLTNINSKIPKVLSGVTDGHLALMNADGTIRDGGVSISQLTGGTGYYVYGEKEVPESTTSVTPITYLTTGATLTEGIFSVDYIGVIGNSVKLKPAYIQFYLDGAAISASFAVIPAENNGVLPMSFMRDRYLSGGTHTFSIRYFAGVNTALMNSAAIRVRKVN